MFEALQNLENIVRHYNGALLLLAGILTMALGLFVWLGGMKWPASIAIAIATVTSFAFVTFVESSTAPFLFPLTFVTTFAISLLLRRVSMAMLATIIATIACLLYIATPSFALHSKWKNPSYPIASHNKAKSQVAYPELTNMLKKHTQFITAQLTASIKTITPIRIILAVIAGLIVGIAGLIFPRLIGSATCAITGTAIIFIAMSILLCQKNAMPLSGITENAVIYRTAAMCMLAFGTISGLLFGKARRIKRFQEQEQFQEQGD